VKPLRILLVDCDSVRAGERGKAERLAALPDVEVHLLVPRAYTLAGRALRFDPAPPVGYRMTVGALVGHPPARTLFAAGLARALRERPDVVHVTADENFFLAAQVARATRRLAPGALFTFHSWGNILFSRALHPQWIPFLYEFDTWLETGVFRAAAGAAARNREVARVLRARGFRGRIAYIPWGTDVERMGSGDRQSGRRRFGLDGFVVGFLGRLVEEKGLLDLVDACATIRGEVTLAVAGEGPYERTIAASVALGLGGSPTNYTIQMLGNVADRDVPDFLAAIDVLALPSRSTPTWKEQFGRALVEAMAAGVPVVGSDSGAISDVIGDAGLVVPERDPRALGEALARLASDPALRERLARAGRERARREFSWGAFASRTAAFFRSLRGEPVEPGSFEEMP